MASEIKYPDVTVALSGHHGNVFYVIGKCQQEIKAKHGADAGKAFAEEAMSQESYDKVLQLCMKTVNVT